MEKKIINLCYHEVNETTTGKTFPPSGIVARLDRIEKTIGFIDGIEIKQACFGEVRNLPEYRDDIMYIVSKHIADALPNRTDLLVPGPVARIGGKPIGCKGFMLGCKLKVNQ